MKTRTALVFAISTLLLAACQQSADTSAESEEGGLVQNEAAEGVVANCAVANDAGILEIAPGLTAKIVKSGWGRSAKVGDYADTNVWLWLYDENAEDHHGEFIWESGNSPFQFQLGAGQVISGWDLGVPCMLEGETRELVVAGDLAYGANGRGAIPPDATLIFTIELVKLTASN